MNSKYTRVFSASGIVAGGPVKLAGIIVNTHSSGVITLSDHASALSGNSPISSYALPSGAAVISFPNPIEFGTGIYFTLVSGTASLSFLTV